MILLGIDGGLGSSGWAIISVSSRQEKFVALGLIETKSADKKLKINSNVDQIRRLSELYEQLSIVIKKYKPECLCVESYSPVMKNMKTVIMSAKAFGLIIGIALDLNIPVFQRTPRQIKLDFTGIKDASKKQIIAEVNFRFNPVDWPTKSISRNSHPADAVAAVFSCLAEKNSRLSLIRRRAK